MTIQSEIINDDRYVPLLNHGFIGLVDSMGNDQSIVRAARVSYGAGTKKISEDRGLIRYLMKHKHTTPFEMVEYCFHIKLPIFVARQHIRHRMASVNEYSGRYSVMSDEFYIPLEDRIQGQDLTNKQASGLLLDDDKKKDVLNIINDIHSKAYAGYQELIGNDIGLSRELSRMVLPVSNYTEMYWKIDLKNLLNYIFLRADAHAQPEIQVYAVAMSDFIQKNCPIAYEAFSDYVQHGIELSRMEIDVMNRILFISNTQKISFSNAWVQLCTPETKWTKLNNRELMEFCNKWNLPL